MNWGAILHIILNDRQIGIRMIMLNAPELI